MALEGKALSVPEKKNLQRWSTHYKALGTINEWAREMMATGSADLNAICQRHRITRTTLNRELKKNPALQEELFGSMATEAKFTLTAAVKEAWKVMNDSEIATTTKLKWATFIAKLVGGAFEKRDAPQVSIGLLIPELPPQLQAAVGTRVIDVKPESLEDLT